MTGQARTRRLGIAHEQVCREHEGAALEREQALVCLRMFGEPSELLRLGRYELLRTLGRGGMGTVYEALDTNRQARVALKMLHGRSPRALYQLKQEFRSLAELSHPNLVRLHELYAADQDAYFTMELIEGCDFFQYVRAGLKPGEAVADEHRLRRALAGLCEGICELHAANKLHRDLKPSNVLVSSEGRVVLVDFGLVHDSAQQASEAAGTPAFMAPEQRLGKPCAASDWFSFGRILEQLLYGLAGTPQGSSRALPVPPTPSYRALEQLVRELLQPDATARPTAEQVLAALHDPTVSRRPAAAVRTSARELPFVGRRLELARLTRALSDSRERSVLVLIRGESGIGKSALVRHFTEAQAAQGNVLILRGRCYEREAVPYKAFDSVIDELSRHLVSSPADASEIASEDRAALVHLFPVLGRVPALALPAPTSDDAPLIERRRRGFSALKALLSGIAKQRALVLCIDDAQWSDADSGQLLGALLCEADAPPMLVIASDRTDRCLLNPAVEELTRFCALSLGEAPLVEVRLGPLAPADSLSVSTAIVSAAFPFASAARQREIASLAARESHGNPLFLTQISPSNARATNGFGAPDAPLSFDSLVSERLAGLSSSARCLLDVIAIAGRPVSAAVVAHAAGFEREPHNTLEELRRARLVHAVRRTQDELLEVDHDRVADAVRRRLTDHGRQALHARLARALESVESAHSDGLVEQYIAAGLPLEAARHARHAGHLAFAALAFARAAWLFQQALELGRFREHERAELHVALARALEHCGRGLEAAHAYRSAALLTAPPLAASKLEQCAADLLMYNGEHTEGERLLMRCYRTHGLWWPRSRAVLVLAILWLALRLQLRLYFGKKTDQPVHRARAEMLGAAGASLEGWDAMRAVYNALLAIGEAEQVDDPAYRARALGVRGLLMCARLLWGGQVRGLLEVESACLAVSQLGDPVAVTELHFQLAYAHLIAGHNRSALWCADRLASELRHVPHPPHALYTAMGLIGTSLLELGDLAEAAQRWPSFAHEARHHGDYMASYWIHTHPLNVALSYARGDRTRVEAVLALQARLCEQHPQFSILTWTHTMCRAETELYWGSAVTAQRLIEEQWSLLSTPGYGFLADAAVLLRARVSLGAAVVLTGAKRARSLRRARADARRLRTCTRISGRGAGKLVEASVSMIRNERTRANAQLSAAIALLDAAESKLVAASARYCQGILIGQEKGAALQHAALDALQTQGIAEPRRWVAWTLPAFRPEL